MAERRTRRRFTREYKAQAVQRVIETGRPLADIAAELDVSPGQLSQWRNEQLAAGSAEALAARKAGPAKPSRPRPSGSGVRSSGSKRRLRSSGKLPLFSLGGSRDHVRLCGSRAGQ